MEFGISFSVLCWLFPFSSEYDVPRPSLETYDTPRNGSLNQGQIAAAMAMPCSADEYDVPSQFKRTSDRSSGVSLLSSGSSDSSALSNVTSASSESLSLSSACGVGAGSNLSGRSSRSSIDICDGPRTQQQANMGELYDVPKSRDVPDETYDVPPAAKEVMPASDLYDIPKAGQKDSNNVVPNEMMLYDIPPSTSSHIRLPDETTYDVPPTPCSLPSLPTTPQRSVACDSYDSPKTKPYFDTGLTYDVPKSLEMSDIKSSLPLELDAALETLARMDQEVCSSLSHLLGLWRHGEVQQTELQLRTLRLRSSLQELVDFAKAAIGNASQLKSGDDQVAIRLSRLLRPLEDAIGIIKKTTNNWSSAFGVNGRRRPNCWTEEFDQLKACCRNLGENVRLVRAHNVFSLFFKYIVCKQVYY